VIEHDEDGGGTLYQVEPYRRQIILRRPDRQDWLQLKCCACEYQAAARGDLLMGNKLKTLTLSTVLAVGVSGVAFAQAYAPNNPISGAAAGASAGAAQGNAAAGPIGGIVGGAIGTATGTLSGTANMITGGPTTAVGTTPAGTPAGTCPPGQVLYQGYCYHQ
jgi:hypothetical protein